MISRLNRALNTTQLGTTKHFLVVQATQLSIKQQLQPEYTEISILTPGSHLDKGKYMLPSAPPDIYYIHIDEKIMPSATRKLSITGIKCKNSAGKVFNKSQNVSTRIFSTQLDAPSKKSLLRDFAHTYHFALMTFE